MAVRGGHRAEQPQFAAQRRAVLAERVLELLILQQRLLGEFFQLFAGVGELHGAVIAQEQRLPEDLFQPLDLAGERRRADVHRLGGAPEVMAFGQMQEQL